MAGEYSRELSAKVFAGKCRLIEFGFRQGKPAGYGLRRILIDEVGNAKEELGSGKQKSILTDRVILAIGPPEEIEIVREIYGRFVFDMASESRIAADLNARAITREDGQAWTFATINQILTNEKYVGNNVWNRTSCKLRTRKVRNPPDMWVRLPAAFPAIIDHALFAMAQAIISDRSAMMSDEEMLGALQALYTRVGLLSSVIIDEAEGLPSSGAYKWRFGSLRRAYELIGYSPRQDYR